MMEPVPVEGWPFGLQDKTSEQLRWMRRALELLTTLRMARRGELSPDTEVWVLAGLSSYDTGLLLGGVAELTDRLLSTVPEEVAQSWLEVLGQSLALAEDLASMREGHPR